MVVRLPKTPPVVSPSRLVLSCVDITRPHSATMSSLLDTPGWRELITRSEKIWIRAGARAARGLLWFWEGAKAVEVVRLSLHATTVDLDRCPSLKAAHHRRNRTLLPELSKVKMSTSRKSNLQPKSKKHLSRSIRSRARRPMPSDEEEKSPREGSSC